MLPKIRTRLRGALRRRPWRAGAFDVAAVARDWFLAARRGKKMRGRSQTGARLGTAGERLPMAATLCSGEYLACFGRRSIHMPQLPCLAYCEILTPCGPPQMCFSVGFLAH